MGTSANRRRKGQGGLYLVPLETWNEFKQAYEVVDHYRAVTEIKDPENPDKRKRITGTAKSPAEAQARMYKSLERYYKKMGMQDAGVVLKGRTKGSQTLSEYFEEWYSELRPERISVTLQLKYKQHFHNHILPHIGKMSLTELSYQDLHNLIYITLPKKKKKKNGLEIDEQLLGPNAILNIYRTLNVALGIAVKKGKIDQNPLSLVDTPKYVPPKENVPQMVHIVEHMFKKMNEADDPMFDHFLLALLGLRRGERLGLTFSSLTLTGNNPKLTIQNQLTRVTGKGLFVKPATKSGKDRTVTLQEPWLSSLKRMKDKRKQQLKLDTFNPEKKFADLVFLKDDGSPYDLNEDNELWKKANQIYNAKRSPIRGHALRHVAATKMADSGVERDVAMAILGHESESISFYYGRMTAKGQVGQVAEYGKALSEKINTNRDSKSQN
jgi:integrase